MKKIITSTLILVAITLIAGLALAAVYEVTKEPIAVAEYNAKMNAYRAVMPAAADFTEVELTDGAYPDGVTVDEIMTAVTADGEKLGHVVKATSSNGYGGKITVAASCPTVVFRPFRLFPSLRRQVSARNAPSRNLPSSSRDSSELSSTLRRARKGRWTP